MVAVGWVSKPAAWSKVLGAACCGHQPILQGDPKGAQQWVGGSPHCPGLDHQPTLPLPPHRGIS